MEKHWPLTVELRSLDKEESSTSIHSSTPITPTTPAPDIKNWPSQTQELADIVKPSFAVIAYDCILILFPIVLLAKAFIVLFFQLPEFVNLNDQLVTLYTVIFATIVGTLVKRYALFKAQKGASVAELEQLQSSISLPKTLSLVWSLRSFTLTSLSLVMIWSYYYLGSQAVSRELKLYDSPPPVDMNVTHMLPSARSVFELGTPSSTMIARMHALIAMPAPGGTGENQYPTGSDVLGNVLVPYFDYYSEHITGTPLSGKWKDWWDTRVRKADREGYVPPIYSSTIGVQLVAKARLKYCGRCAPYLTDKISGKSSITTSYVQLNCSFPNIQDNSTFVSGSPFIRTVLNITDDIVPTIRVSQRWNQSIIVSNCNLTETKVEMQVLCETGDCVSQKARRWPNQPLSSTLFQNKTAAATFFDELLHAGGTPSSESDMLAIDRSDIFQHWKSFQTDPQIFNGSPWLGQMGLFKQIMRSTDVFLTQTINGYLSASQQVLFNSTDPAIMMKLLDGETQNPSVALATLNGGPFDPSYRVNYIWVAIDFLSCFVLLAAAAVAVHLRRKTLAPDIFGYVSSLTRDNPQINLPEGGSTLSGLERARMLKKVKVKIADVGGDDGVGRVGLARLGSAESMTGVKDLEKGKRYV